MLAWKRGGQGGRRGGSGRGLRPGGSGRAPVQGGRRRGGGEGRNLGRLPLRGHLGRRRAGRPQGHRPRRGTCQRGRLAVRARRDRAQVPGAPQRIRRGGVRRTQLAAGARGLRRMAAGEPPPEHPERLAHPTAGPGRHASARRSSSSWSGATSAWPPAGSRAGTGLTDGRGSTSRCRAKKSPSNPACSCSARTGRRRSGRGRMRGQEQARDWSRDREWSRGRERNRDLE